MSVIARYRPAGRLSRLPDATVRVSPDGTATTVTVVATLAPCRPSVVTVNDPDAACAVAAGTNSGASMATPTKANGMRLVRPTRAALMTTP